jgi:hypothetical protein
MHACLAEIEMVEDGPDMVVEAGEISEDDGIIEVISPFG